MQIVSLAKAREEAARMPKHHKTDKEHHAAIPYAQVPAFITTIRSAAAGEPTKLAFEFLILTSARTGEVIGATWDEIDFEGKTGTIGGERMKARKAHRVPLSPRCIDIVTSAKAMSDGGRYVFPGRYQDKPLSNTVFLMQLRRLGRDDITGHGFRSAFRDWTAERTNFRREVCEAALAHVVENKVEAAYLRTDLFERRRSLMIAWEKFATTDTPKVVSIRERSKGKSA